MLQLAAHPAIGAPQLQMILAAVASQVSPPGAHFYIYAESERLARPVFYAGQRQLLPAESWARWFEGLADPAPFASWDAAFTSQAGLARRHNTLAFLRALHLHRLSRRWRAITTD